MGPIQNAQLRSLSVSQALTDLILNLTQYTRLAWSRVFTTGGKYIGVFVKYGVNTQWMDLSLTQTFKFKWWTVSCGSVLDAFSPVITLTNWTSWFAVRRNVLTRLSMPNAVSVGTRQRLWGCQSAVSITCCVAEVSYVASTDRDRNMFWRRYTWQRAAFHFREIN